jgi:hypothetical protein
MEFIKFRFGFIQSIQCLSITEKHVGGEMKKKRHCIAKEEGFRV